MPANHKIFAQVDEKNNLSEHLRVCGQDARRSARKIIFSQRKLSVARLSALGAGYSAWLF